ncbi:B12-binding domain-containing radical SAM protein [Desulfatibacillum aliphaticivorans]|uniref:B12-binding domain-containing radical SAM protein n=1 Tax=Desulfatibacillum aliphaticivorans TaxID=218208 RepID=UPI00143A0B33|nr:radical SAM protein [Desulfatibacillum aliphaticivorans]
MARVLMIKPKHPHFKGLNKTATPPLGLMSLAAYARERRPGKDVFCIADERVTPRTMDDWTDLVREFHPDLIAVSAMTVEGRRLEKIAARFKADFPEIPIIVGGPLASASGARILESGNIDYILRGEGEVGFIDFLDAKEQGDRFPERPISGLAFRNENQTLVENPMNLHVPDMDEIPIPAWDLIDLSDYQSLSHFTPIDSSSRYAVLFTSRGCPYGCIYCHRIFSKKFRPMNAYRVVDEMECLVKKYQVETFEIVDDIFNLDYGRAMEFCREIKKRGLKVRISFPNGVRGDLLDPDLIRELASVGVYEMAFAVETASPRVQKLIRKNIKLDKIRENIAIAAEAGIFTWGFFMLGFPSETRKELMQTIKFACTSRLHGAYFFTVVPFEGTDLAAMAAAQHGLQPKDLWGDYHHIHKSIAGVSARELSLFQALAFSLFFFDPRRAYRILRDYPLDRMQAVRKFLALSYFLFIEKPLGLIKDSFHSPARSARD